MSRLLISCFFVLLSAENLIAGVGLKGGVSVSGLLSRTGDFRHFLGYEVDWLPMGNLTGFQIGVFDTFDVSTSLALQPEVHFAVRGGDASADFEFERIVFQTKISYIEFPLLLQYRIPWKRRFRPSLFLGPYGALKLSAEKHTVIQGRKERAALDNVNTLDYGVVVGGCIERDMLSGQLILDLRFSLGLKDIMTMPDGYIRLYEEEDSIRNFAFVLMVGYRF